MYVFEICPSRLQASAITGDMFGFTHFACLTAHIIPYLTIDKKFSVVRSELYAGHHTGAPLSVL